MSINELQGRINEAQQIREESWDECKKSYTKTNRQAALEACQRPPDSTDWTQVVYLLNQLAWNDAQDVKFVP